MNWFYTEQGKQAGPVTDEQFEALQKAGTITLDTLVWHEGMANWVPLRQFQPGAESTPVLPLNPDGSQVVCAECGGIFPVDETIRHGNVHVCAACKPIFLQKLSEGVELPTGELKYARILTRFAAVFLDGLMLLMFNVAMNFLFLGTAFRGLHPERATPQFGFLGILLLAIQWLVPATYETVMIGKYGATLGKMACKIKVVTADGGRVSYARSLGRYFAKMLSGFTCAIGYLIACFDKPQKRALHDHICNTRVIEK